MKNQVKTEAENGQECLEHFYQNEQRSKWVKLFSKLLIGLPGWASTRCTLTWKMRISKFKRTYFKLLAGRQNELLPTVTTSDGTRGGQIVFGRYKTRPSGVTYFSTLSDLAKSGLLPTPTVREHKGGRQPDKLMAKGRKPSNSLGDTINSITGSCTKLNPLFITEMMGFPLRWVLHPFLKEQLISRGLMVS